MKNPYRLNTNHAWAILSLALIPLVHGQVTTTYTWSGAGDGLWSVASNWKIGEAEAPSFPVALTDAARITNGFTVTLDNSTSVEVGSIYVAGASGSKLILNGENTHYARQILVGAEVVGELILNGTENGGELDLVSQNDAAELVPQLQIGREASGVGTFTQTGGILDCSAVNLEGGHQDVWVGAFGATGTYNLQGGTATMWNLRVGFASAQGGGTVNHSGGTLTHHGDFALGWASPNGVYNLSGTGNLLIPTPNQRVRIGATGGASGIFNQTGGTATLNARFELGTEGGATGFYNMSGGTMTITNDIIVGTFGDNVGTAGTYTQTGGLVDVNRVRVCYGAGTIGKVYLNGGTLMTDTIFRENATGDATLSFNGGTIMATGGGDFIHGFPLVTLNAGGGVFDSNNQGDTIVPPVVGVGGFTKRGLGFMSLAVQSDYSGNTSVEQGILRLNVAGGLEPTSTVSIAATGAQLDLTYAGSDTVGGLIVGGVAMAAGTYGALPTVEGDHIGLEQITGTGKLVVVPAAVTGYDTWAGNPVNGLAEGQRDPGFDADNDGFDNLTEYFLGGNPMVSSSDIAPQLALAGSDMKISFERSVESGSDTTAVVQWSTDLSSWPPANDIVVTGTGPITMTVPGSNAVNGRIFARLRITKP